MLQHVLNQPATAIVEDHQNSQGDLEFVAEGNEAELLVHFGDELGGAGESHARSGHETPVHGLVLTDRLTEWTALVVDGEGRNLLDELEKIDGAVEKRWFEFTLEIDVVIPPAEVLA